MNFCNYMFFDKILFGLSTSWWNFKKSANKLKQQFNNVCTKPNLYSSGIKLIKLVYTSLNVSSLKTLVTNFCFLEYFNINKGKWPVYCSLDWKVHVLMFFINISKKIANFLIYQTKQKYYPGIFCNKVVSNILGNHSGNYCHDNKRKVVANVGPKGELIATVIFLIKQNIRFFCFVF